MPDETLDRLLQRLDHIRRRPGMFVGTHDVARVIDLLTGFGVGVLATLNRDWDHDLRVQVIKSRGWKWTPDHISHQMVAKGMSADEIISELVDIEGDVLKRILAEMQPVRDPAAG